MRLSMWMIANRLSGFTMENNISHRAKPILRSARRVYSTDCIRVAQDGDAVVCSSEEDSIRLYNLSLAEGFEIIQGVFDFYEDWSDALEAAVREQDYQKVVDLAWQVIQNPIILMDGNGRAKAITRQYPADALDSEWSYLWNYSYTSMKAVQQLQTGTQNEVFWRRGFQHFLPGKGAALSFGGVSYGIFCQDAFCGRMTILEKDRRLNPGDEQLLEYICLRLEPILGQSRSWEMSSSVNVFHQLLLRQPYDPADLDFQLQYFGWDREDIYSLALVMPAEDRDISFQSKDAERLMQVILSQNMNCAVVRRSTQLYLVANRDMTADQRLWSFLQSLCQSNPIKVSVSLACRGIESIPDQVRQAEYAMEIGKRNKSQARFYKFFDYGADYLLEANGLEAAVHGCIPEVVQLWDQQDNADQFLTLKVFLENERSVSKTAEAMFTHRNTIIYRLRRIVELLHLDLEDNYEREYCRLSVQVLDLYSRRKRQTGIVELPAE